MQLRPIFPPPSTRQGVAAAAYQAYAWMPQHPRSMGNSDAWPAFAKETENTDSGALERQCSPWYFYIPRAVGYLHFRGHFVYVVIFDEMYNINYKAYDVYFIMHVISQIQLQAFQIQFSIVFVSTVDLASLIIFLLFLIQYWCWLFKSLFSLPTLTSLCCSVL